MGTLSGLEDLAGLAADMARLEMDRDSCDIVFMVRVTRFGKFIQGFNVDISRLGEMRPG